MAELARGVLPIVVLGLRLSADIGSIISDLSTVPEEVLFISRELTSLCGLLNCLNDIARSPSSTQAVFIPEIITELEVVLVQVNKTFKSLELMVGKYLGRRHGKMTTLERMRWSLGGRADFEKFGKLLEAHKQTINISLSFTTR